MCIFKDFTVEENMKFLHVIAKDRNIDADIDPLRAFHSYYLTEEKKTSECIEEEPPLYCTRKKQITFVHVIMFPL